MKYNLRLMTITRPFSGENRVPKAEGESLTCSHTFHWLHIDDSPDDRLVFQAACKRARLGVHWQVAESAKRALEYFRELIAKSRNEEVCWPDLVLLDLGLGGEGGFEVLRYIRTNPLLRGLRMIMFTGQEDPTLKEEAFRLGADSVVIKPVTFEQLVVLARDLFVKWGA